MSERTDVVDATVVRAWGTHGVDALARARDALDRANVFPVADADTGTNLYLTFCDAARTLADAPANAGAGALLAGMARGALLGARGNSGVILSEYLRGLAVEVASSRGASAGGDLDAAGSVDSVDAVDAVDVVDAGTLVRALVTGAAAARAAVAAPAPGTVLVAADAAADAAAQVRPDGPGLAVVRVVEAARDGARAAAVRSPRELDALARAGVLDAGALGLVLLLDALRCALGAGPVDVSVVPGMLAPDAGGARPDRSETAGRRPEVPGGDEATGGEFEVMYVVEATTAQAAQAAQVAPRLRAALGRVGDSVVVVGGAPGQGTPVDAPGARRVAGVWQAHVHTDHPLEAVQAVRGWLDGGGPSAGGAQGTEGARGTVAGLRQVRVRHLPGAARDPGLVAVTTSPGLLPDLARAGAVVLLREPGAAPDLDAVHRVAVDARSSHVLLLGDAGLGPSGLATLGARLRAEGVELEVVPTPTDLHVAAALAAGQLLDAATSAAARAAALRRAAAGVRVRVVGAAPPAAPRSPGAEDVTSADVRGDALGDALAELLAAEPETAVVLALVDQDAPRGALAAAAGLLRDRAPAAELVVLGSGRRGGVVELATERPRAAAGAPTDGRETT